MTPAATPVGRCVCLLSVLATVAVPPVAAQSVRRDTVRLEVGTPLIDGRGFQPYVARGRTVIDGRAPSEVALSVTMRDSAGRRLMIVATRGTIPADSGPPVQYDLIQVYDARSLALVSYLFAQSDGDTTRLTIDGRRVRGVRSVRAPARVAITQRRRFIPEPVDRTLDHTGFDSGIESLLPMAVGLRPGLVIVAPILNHSSGVSYMTALTVVGRETIRVEGTRIEAYKVEQRRDGSRTVSSTWYLMDSPPYLASGETVVPGGPVVRFTRARR